MTKLLAGQRALVTGASDGIGAELARQLAALGADLVITARREQRLRALAREIIEESGTDVQVEAIDLCDPATPRALFSRTEEAQIPVDLLVNNAGFGAYDDFLTIPWQRHQRLLQLNIVALTQLSHLFAAAMVGRGRGRIMNLASVSAYLPCPGFAVYSAAKTYVRNFTEALAYELRGSGVSATSVCPGGTRTAFLDQAGMTLQKSGEMHMMSAADCARIAIRNTLAGHSNVITGSSNALLMFVLRWVPRSWLAPLAFKVMTRSVEKSKTARQP